MTRRCSSASAITNSDLFRRDLCTCSPRESFVHLDAVRAFGRTRRGDRRRVDHSDVPLGAMIAVGVLQNILDPAGPQAAHISRLWWLMFWVAAAVFVSVLSFLLVALVKRNRASTESSLTFGVATATAATVATLLVLLGATMFTQRSVASLGAASAVTIELTGHQFWWEVQYDDADPSRRVTTANEFHIPVGRPVVLKVTSRDVIHSFWAPNLTGKRDLIPGYTTAIW